MHQIDDQWKPSTNKVINHVIATLDSRLYRIVQNHIEFIEYLQSY